MEENEKATTVSVPTTTKKNLQVITSILLTIKKKLLKKLKINNFSYCIKYLRSQDKLPPKNLQRQVNTETNNLIGAELQIQ